MYIRPTNRVEQVTGSTAEALIACTGVDEQGNYCGRLIAISWSEKSHCPHCGKIYHGFAAYCREREVRLKAI